MDSDQIPWSPLILQKRTFYLMKKFTYVLRQTSSEPKLYNGLKVHGV
jgi:hypothetical protein